MDSDGIHVLASDSDESIKFVVERPSASIQGPHIIMRATTQALPTFSSSDSDASSCLGKSLITKYYIYVHSIYDMQFIRFPNNTNCITSHILEGLEESLHVIIVETPSSCQEAT